MLFNCDLLALVFERVIHDSSALVCLLEMVLKYSSSSVVLLLDSLAINPLCVTLVFIRSNALLAI